VWQLFPKLQKLSSAGEGTFAAFGKNIHLTHEWRSKSSIENVISHTSQQILFLIFERPRVFGSHCFAKLGRTLLH
jgi:hypothetical protein